MSESALVRLESHQLLLGCSTGPDKGLLDSALTRTNIILFSKKRIEAFLSRQLSSSAHGAQMNRRYNFPTSADMLYTWVFIRLNSTITFPRSKAVASFGCRQKSIPKGDGRAI